MGKGYKYTDEQWKAITNADCVETARALGYEFDEKRSDRSALRIKNNGGMFVWRDGSGWYCHSTCKKGNAVELVMETQNCTYQKAMDFIFTGVLGRSDYEINRHEHTSYTRQSQKIKEEDAEFELPKGVKQPKRVFAYLQKTRYISRSVIEDAVERKIIYQDEEHGNCCFVGYDKDNVPRYCTKRGTVTNQQFRGEVSGSDKKYAWKMQGSLESDCKLYIFEAPIDAMSHAALNELAGRDWKKDTRLSMGGCSMLPIEQHLKDYPGKYNEIIICTDNDERGNQMADIITEKLSGGYKVSRRLSFLKDWNEDLKKIAHISEKSGLSMKKAMDRFYCSGIYCRQEQKEAECEDADEIEACL